MRRPDGFNDRHLMAKHAAIYPTEQEVTVDDKEPCNDKWLDVDVVNVDDSAARCYVFSNNSYSCEI